MWLEFLGTRGEVEESSPEHAKHSGLVIGYGPRQLLVDLGEQEFMDTYVGILLTHYHPDHFCLKEGDYPDLVVYSSRDILRLIPKEVKIQKKPIPLGTTISINGYKVQAFRTLHSVKTPSVGYKVWAGRRCVFVSGDVININNRQEALAGVDAYIGDGSFLTQEMVRRRDKEIYGHTSVLRQLKWCNEAGIKLAFFTHWGTEAIKLGKRLQARLEELAREVAPKTRVIVATDGLHYSLDALVGIKTDEIEQIRIAEIEPVAGLILVAPHGRLVWEGKKTAMVKTREYTKYINQPLWLISEGKVWGIVQYKEPRKITWEEFLELQPFHAITEQEAIEWGWKGKELYYYPLVLLEKFDQPLECKYKLGPQVFVREVEISAV